MKEAAKVLAIVFLLQIGLLGSLVIYLQSYGGSVAHLALTQDTKGYVLLAESLLADGGYHLPGFTVPETFRVPGYPFFIAVVYKLSGNSIYALLAVLALVGSLASGLVYLIGRELSLPRSWAFCAAILFGISPAVVWVPVSGMSDITFAFLLLLALYLLVRIPRARRAWLHAGLIGLVLGLATLNRSVGLYLALILIISIPFFTDAHFVSRKTIALFGIALLTFSLSVVPWMMRNQAVAGHFALSSQFAFNPFFYNIPAFLAWQNHTSEQAEREKLMDSVGTRDEYALVNGFIYYDQLKTIDKRFLKEHLGPYTYFHAIKTLPFFFGSGLNAAYALITNEIPTMPDVAFFPRADRNTASLFYGGDFISVAKNLLYFWPATVERILWLALFALAFIAPFVTRGRQRTFAILGVIVTFTIALFAIPIAQPRYRIPAEPFIWLSAALTLCAFSHRHSKVLSESQHNTEIENNRVAWGKKPLLQQLYRDFYEKMFAFVRTDISGNVVELGSGLGAFKAVYPNVITTDLFANPGIDRVENAYHLSFKQGEASNLILFDVFHHLRYPGQALEEFARVLPRDGRVIMFEPYISVLGALVYGLFHHESVALKQKISWFPPRDASMDNSYYAAQGNATRIFSVSSLYKEDVQKNWRLIKKEKCSALSYVLSGGFSKPCLYPLSLLPVIRGVERALDCLPLLFATRVLIVLERK